ncbi:MAG TPA: MBL fold metallo-hydrolase [Dehalococcoidia bacterium]|nr:MBL fold metallo-hydrolase [Dehalococcoidia bacterium]
MQYRSEGLQVVKVGPLGPFANNSYVVFDPARREAVVVDAPQESEKVLPHLEGLRVLGILITHRHGDHWGGIDVLREKTGAPIYCHADDAAGREVSGTLAHGQEVAVGGGTVRVLHTPGHTPGSICLLAGNHLISGDTLFPGGPGRTMKPEDLQQEIESIRTHLFALPDSTLVLPGHGDDTTIGDAKREYAVFASKSHPPDLCGDVTWLGS